MSDNTQSKITWLDRLSLALLREPQNREQLVELLRDAHQRNLIDADALSMIEGVLLVSQMQVRDIMVPRSQMVVVSEDQTLDQFLPLIIDSQHSRFPVTGDNKDEVIGILLAKDLLPYCADRSQPLHIRDILRPARVLPESLRLDVLLKDFRNSNLHMAIVVDEYGGVAGLVTIEDVLEQIVGEIEDEFDVEEEANIKKRSDVEYSVKSQTEIEDFNKYFSTQFSDEEFDTIGGVVLHAFGHMPKRNEKVVIGNIEFEVLNADNRRIHLLQVKYLTSDASEK